MFEKDKNEIIIKKKKYETIISLKEWLSCVEIEDLRYEKKDIPFKDKDNEFKRMLLLEFI